MKNKTIFKVIFILMTVLLFCTCEKPEIPNAPPEKIPESLKTGLPIIFIYTKDGNPIVSKENYLQANVYVIDLENPKNDLTAVSSVKGRGNDTWGLPKKPYRLKFNEKQSLFGLTDAKNWILLANYRDYTLMMNSVAFELGQQFGLPYTHHAIPVEVVVNDVHLGSYVLTENKEVGKGRVNIDKSGGWFVEADNHYDEEPKFKSNILKLPLMISYPEDLPNSEYSFVKNDINQFEAKLFESNYPNNDFMDLMNVNTFIDYIMINDIVQNYDLLHPKSMYWYKEGSDKKISLGPLWDFDWAFGFNSTSGKYFHEYGGTIFGDTSKIGGIGGKLFGKLYESPELRARYKARWNEQYQTILGITEFMDAYAKTVEKSQKRNAAIWGWRGNDPDYMTEIERMKQWWINRVTFLNSEIQNY
jgi:CotH protein.